jgi:hypothetical protein
LLLFATAVEKTALESYGQHRERPKKQTRCQAQVRQFTLEPDNENQDDLGSKIKWRYPKRKLDLEGEG